MNPTLQLIHRRRSVSAYEDRPIERPVIDAIIGAAMRAPTAGNMMLYSIIEIDDRTLKNKLAESCDNQPFIAKAPLVLLFVADYQRWFDFFEASDVAGYCKAHHQPMRRPQEGDLMLACCDALIAAQTAAIAAESLGIGSCYIGDIMENHNYHRELLHLPRYTFPITLLCFGYPKEAPGHKLRPRFPQASIHFTNGYRRLDKAELDDMFRDRDPKHYVNEAANVGQHFYARKFSADYSVEMSRSVKEAIRRWTEG